MKDRALATEEIRFSLLSASMRSVLLLTLINWLISNRLHFNQQMRMRQLMHSNRSSRRALVVEVLAIHIVISGKVVHVDEKCRYLSDVAQRRSSTGQNVAHILNYRAGLRADIEASRA